MLNSVIQSEQLNAQVTVDEWASTDAAVPELLKQGGIPAVVSGKKTKQDKEGKGGVLYSTVGVADPVDAEENSVAVNPLEEPGPHYAAPAVPYMLLFLLLLSACAQGFSSTVLSFIIRKDLKFEPVQEQQYWAYVSIISFFQPLLGWISDVFVVWGEKRRPLFILCVGLNVLIYFFYYCFPGWIAHFSVFLCFSLVSQCMMMGTYIPLNGILVEFGRRDAESTEQSTARLGAIMAVAMVWRSVGSLAASLQHNLLILCCSNHTLLLVVCIEFLSLILVILWLPSDLFARSSAAQHKFTERMSECWGQFRQSCNLRSLHSEGVIFFLVLCFVFFYTFMPDASTVYGNYTFSAFNIQPWVLSLSYTCGSVGSIAGAYVFSLWMKHRAAQEERGGRPTSLFTIFLLGSVAWAFGYVTNMLLCTGFVTDVLHISPSVYICIDGFFVSMFVRFAFMPTLTMAAEHAPKNFEATTFEVFSVVSIIGGTCSSFLTGAIANAMHISRADYSKLPDLILISVFCKLLPIPVAYILPKKEQSVEGTDVVIESEEANEREA